MLKKHKSTVFWLNSNYLFMRHCSLLVVLNYSSISGREKAQELLLKYLQWSVSVTQQIIRKNFVDERVLQIQHPFETVEEKRYNGEWKKFLQKYTISNKYIRCSQKFHLVDDNKWWCMEKLFARQVAFAFVSTTESFKKSPTFTTH